MAAPPAAAAAPAPPAPVAPVPVPVPAVLGPPPAPAVAHPAVALHGLHGLFGPPFPPHVLLGNIPAPAGAGAAAAAVQAAPAGRVPHVRFNLVAKRAAPAAAAADQRRHAKVAKVARTLKWRCSDCNKFYATEAEAREEGPQHGLGCSRSPRFSPGAELLLAAAEDNLADADKQVDDLTVMLAAADKQVNDLTVMLAERDAQVDELKQQALADSVQQANLTADHKELQELHRCPVCKEDKGKECIFLGRAVDGAYPCGHGTCMKCYQHLRTIAVANSLGEQDRLAKCPLCNEEISKMHPFAGHKSVYVV